MTNLDWRVFRRSGRRFAGKNMLWSSIEAAASGW
jgi:hypothetical protein